jgi:hypothetical protein
VEIHTELHNLNVLFDVHVTYDAADRVINEGDAARTKPVVIVFELDRPIVPERPLNARACSPADPRLRSLKTKRAKKVGRAVIVAGPSNATFGVEQPSVPPVMLARKSVLTLKLTTSPGTAGKAALVLPPIFPPDASPSIPTTQLGAN